MASTNFTGDGYYWKKDKLYSSADGKEVGANVYNAVSDIANREGVDLGVAASMYRANEVNGNGNYGTGAYKQEVEAAANAAAAKGTSGLFARQPGESNADIAARALATRQAQTGGQIVNYGAGPVLVGGNGQNASANSGGGQKTSTETSSAPETKPAQNSPAAPEYKPIESGTAASPSGNLQAETSAGYGFLDQVSEAAYQQAIATLTAAQKNAPVYANSYEGQLKSLYDQIVNRDPFNYDINSDMLYRQYAQQYMDNGRLAMQDTMGQAAALTGGYGSSYGQAVGQQQYNAYLQQLNDVIPELYSQAYQHYMDEGDRLAQQYNMLYGMAEDEYNKYSDEYNRWADNRNFAYDQAIDARDFAYQQGIDSRNFQYQLDQDAYNRAAAERDYALQLSEINREQYNLDRNYGLSAQQALWNQENADRNYNLSYQEALWSQENADRNYGLNYQQSLWDQENADRSYNLNEQKAIWDQENADRDYLLNERKLDHTISMDDRDYQLQLEKFFYQQANDQRDYDLSVAKMNQDAAIAAANAADPYTDNPYQQVQDTISYLKSVGAETPEDALDMLMAMGMKEDQALAYANLFDAYGGKFEENPQLSYGNGGKAVHNDGLSTPMSDGFTTVWSDIRNKFDAGATQSEIAQRLKAAVDNGRITAYEAELIIDQLDNQ